MLCTKCKQAELITKVESASVSLGGIFGALIFLGGVVLLLASPVIGLLTILVGVVISMAGRGKVTTLVCPACRDKTRI
jgi:hypothetical protein